MHGFLLTSSFFSNVQTPNIVGFVFGVAQMMLYMVYKKKGMCRQQQIQYTDCHCAKGRGSDPQVETVNHPQQNSETPSNNREIEVVVVNSD